MGFCVVKGDLLKQKTEAIVIPIAPHLRLEGSLGTQIKNACGKKLEYEIKQLKNLKLTEAVIVNAYNLDCNKIIMVADPKWDGGDNNEEYNLSECYKNALAVAETFDINSVSFPILAIGAYNFPKRKAIEIAIQAINEYIEDIDLDVALVVYDEETYKTYKDIFSKYTIVGGHLNKKIKEHIQMVLEERRRFGWYKKNTEQILDEGTKNKQFKDRLEYYRVQKGLNKTDCYIGIISKTSFNNILNGAIPKKNTVILLGINMGLSVYEIDDLLNPLGESFNYMNDRDQIIMHGIDNCQDIDEINALLIADGQYPLLKNN